MKEMYSIYDSKAEAYMEPWFTENDQTATRAFAHSCNDKTHPLGQAPADYTLFKIAKWDGQTGRVINEETKINLGTGHEYVVPKNDDNHDMFLQAELEDQRNNPHSKLNGGVE